MAYPPFDPISFAGLWFAHWTFRAFYIFFHFPAPFIKSFNTFCLIFLFLFRFFVFSAALCIFIHSCLRSAGNASSTIGFLLVSNSALTNFCFVVSAFSASRSLRAISNSSSESCGSHRNEVRYGGSVLYSCNVRSKIFWIFLVHNSGGIFIFSFFILPPNSFFRKVS